MEHIKMNTMSYYHDLHLKTDILLLLDLFQRFIDTYLEYYGLDPCYYFSSLGLSWSYDVIEPTKFILYLDANNLYGGAMSEYLHYGRFNWLNKTKLINSV